jgi:hypothetical protein
LRIEFLNGQRIFDERRPCKRLASDAREVFRRLLKDLRGLEDLVTDTPKP